MYARRAYCIKQGSRTLYQTYTSSCFFICSNAYHLTCLTLFSLTFCASQRPSINYAAMLNKIMWEQGVYQVFNALDDASKNEIMVKGSMVTKQQNCGSLKIKFRRLALKIFQRKVPQLDEKEINRKRKEVSRFCQLLRMMFYLSLSLPTR